MTWKQESALISKKRKEQLNQLSQESLSTQLGYKNGQFISNVERALCGIPLAKMAAVCRILDIPEDELIDVKVRDFRDRLTNEMKQGNISGNTQNNH